MKRLPGAETPNAAIPAAALRSRPPRRHVLLVAAILLSTMGHARADSDGTAIVRTDVTEYLIPIVCRDSAQATAGFSTEPSRVTRAATGRSSLVRLTVRHWKDTGELLITLDRYAAWVMAPASTGSRFEIALDMSPSSFQRDGLPVTLTHDLWTAGERPDGLKNVHIEADCSARDPDAPSSRRIEPAEG